MGDAMNREVTEALLPCPWCGSPGEHFKPPLASPRVGCTNEECEVQPAAWDEDTWNTRIQSPDPATVALQEDVASVRHWLDVERASSHAIPLGAIMKIVAALSAPKEGTNG